MQPVFHCDLHSFQEGSQPPTYGLTLTSHLHVIISPLPLVFRTTESYHLRIPSEIPRQYRKVIIQQQTIQQLKGKKHPLTRIIQHCSTNNTKQGETPTQTHKKKTKCLISKQTIVLTSDFLHYSHSISSYVFGRFFFQSISPIKTPSNRPT